MMRTEPRELTRAVPATLGRHVVPGNTQWIRRMRDRALRLSSRRD